VRPLVNLVRHHPEPTEREAEDRDRACPGGFERSHEKKEKHRNGKKSDIAVRVDKTSPQKIIRIDVVQAERHEKATADYRKIIPPPGVGAPVNEPRPEVGRRDSAGDRHRHPPLQQIEPRDEADCQRSQHDECCGDRQPPDERLPACRVVAARQIDRDG